MENKSASGSRGFQLTSRALQRSIQVSQWIIKAGWSLQFTGTVVLNYRRQGAFQWKPSQPPLLHLAWWIRGQISQANKLLILRLNCFSSNRPCTGRWVGLPLKRRNCFIRHQVANIILRQILFFLADQRVVCPSPLHILSTLRTVCTLLNHKIVIAMWILLLLCQNSFSFSTDCSSSS